MNEEKKRPEQETKAPAQIDITPGEPTAPAAVEPYQSDGRLTICNHHNF